MDATSIITLICVVAAIAGIIVFIVARIAAKSKKKKSGAGNDSERVRNVPGTFDKIPPRPQVIVGAGQSSTSENGVASKAVCATVRIEETKQDLREEKKVEYVAKPAKQASKVNVNEVSEETAVKKEIKKPLTVEEYLIALPELDEDGLPLQVKHVFPAETAENAKLCDLASEHVAKGDFDKAAELYYSAAERGSQRGKAMCGFMMTVPGMEAWKAGERTEQIVGWIFELSNVNRHPYGAGLELFITAVNRGDNFDGMSDEEIEAAIDDVRTTFADALIKACDPFAHFLLLAMYAGKLQSVVPEFCEDDEKYAKLLIQTCRLCNEFCYCGDSAAEREKSLTFGNKSVFALGMYCLSDELYKRKSYKSALACAMKAAELFADNGDDTGMAELCCARCAEMYADGTGTEQDIESAQKMLEKAAEFAEEGTLDDYTLIVARKIEKKKNAGESLREFVRENQEKRKFSLEDLEEITQKLQEFSARAAERRKEQEKKEEEKRRKQTQSVPPLVGRIEEVGNSNYFVSNGMYYKIFDISSDGKEIEVDRGYLYGIGRYKIKKE